jgi:hypothetical protein
MLRRRKLLKTAVLFLGLLPIASAAEPVGAPATPEVWARTELYFGTNNRNGQLADAEFSRFIDSEVARLFPDGWTVLTGYGQYRSSSGALIRERSHLLILLYPPQLHDADKRIEEIRRRYKQAYGQESVLRVDSIAFISF